jgi:hypothetical protein
MSVVREPVRSRGFALAGVRVSKYDTLEDVIEKLIKAWRRRLPYRFSELARELERTFAVEVAFETLGTVSGSCGTVHRARHQYIVVRMAGRRVAYRLWNIVWVEDKKDDPVIAHYTKVERVKPPA